MPANLTQKHMVTVQPINVKPTDLGQYGRAKLQPDPKVNPVTISDEGAKKTTDTETQKPGTVSKPRKPKGRLGDIEDYLKSCYLFRYNVINDRIELAEINKSQYRTMDDYSLNSIVRQMERKANIKTSGERIKSLLKSDFTPIFHPVRAYFKGFANRPNEGKTDTIAALAATIILADVTASADTAVKKAEIFFESLKRWLVATVANALTPDGCQNHTCLTLTGDQGAFKTTWLNLLCPVDLLAYLFTGRVDLNNKDTLILLSEKFIINLDDQLRALNKQDAETVKTLITQGNITARRPYAAFASDLSRLGSFCASVNGNDFLTDTTGSRRFLPFEVAEIKIDIAQSINMNDVWCEAYHLFISGYRYWFTSEEIQEWFDGNESFQVQNLEDELLLQYFEPTEKENGRFFLSSDMKKHIESISGQKLDVRLFAKALSKAKFIRFARKFGKKSLYGFAAIERPADDSEDKLGF